MVVLKTEEMPVLPPLPSLECLFLVLEAAPYQPFARGAVSLETMSALENKIDFSKLRKLGLSRMYFQADGVPWVLERMAHLCELRVELEHPSLLVDALIDTAGDSSLFYNLKALHIGQPYSWMDVIDTAEEALGTVPWIRSLAGLLSGLRCISTIHGIYTIHRSSVAASDVQLVPTSRPPLRAYFTKVYW